MGTFLAVQSQQIYHYAGFPARRVAMTMKAKKISGSSLLLIITFFCRAVAPALAADCKTIASVQHSANPENNTADGGHLTGHIRGATPPPGWSYTDKSLFTSQEEYLGAWRNYVKSTKIPSVNCSGVQAQQSVSVETLLHKPSIGAISCKDATCNLSNKTQFPRIFFGYILHNGNWILNTAFPSN
jgi:hypothetical protein